MARPNPATVREGFKGIADQMSEGVPAGSKAEKIIRKSVGNAAKNASVARKQSAPKMGGGY